MFVFSNYAQFLSYAWRNMEGRTHLLKSREKLRHSRIILTGMAQFQKNAKKQLYSGISGEPCVNWQYHSCDCTCRLLITQKEYAA